MTEFFTSLFADGVDEKDYYKLLRRLTEVNLFNLRAIKVADAWDIWAGEPAQ